MKLFALRLIPFKQLGWPDAEHVAKGRQEFRVNACGTPTNTSKPIDGRFGYAELLRGLGDLVRRHPTLLHQLFQADSHTAEDSAVTGTCGSGGMRSNLYVMDHAQREGAGHPPTDDPADHLTPEEILEVCGE